MLARCLLGVSFRATVCSQDFQTKCGHFCRLELSFGRPDASIFGPWGTILASWGAPLGANGAAETTPWRSESDDGKHSLE